MTRVLLVDDHKLVRDGMKLLFNYRKGYEVIGDAEDGISAIKLIEEFHPDLILMDVFMKKMNGIETSSQIIKKFPNSRILLISIGSNESFMKTAMHSGARGYISKAYGFNEIVEIIEKILMDENNFYYNITGKLSSFPIEKEAKKV